MEELNFLAVELVLLLDVIDHHQGSNIRGNGIKTAKRDNEDPLPLGLFVVFADEINDPRNLA